MRANRKAAIDRLLKDEGGYVDHPKDPGGCTNFGITLSTYQRLRDPQADCETIRHLRQSEARAIYAETYWVAVNGDNLPPGLDLAVLDFAVNAGPRRAAKLLQRLVGAGQDGQIGPLTLALVWERMGESLLEDYRDARLAYYRSLSTYRTFGRGWTRRTLDTHGAALAWWQAEQVAVQVEDPSPDERSGLLSWIQEALA